MGKFQAPTPVTQKGTKSQSRRGSSIPSASAITASSPGKKARLELVACPVVAHVCRYSDCGAAHSEFVPERQPVDQVQVTHEAKPSVLYMMGNNLEEFLQEQQTTTPGGPANIKEWETQWQCRFVITSKEDPDNIGYIPWRVAFYVSGGPACVQNFLMVFDAFCHWRTTSKTGERFQEAAALTIQHDPRSALVIDAK